MKRKFSAGAAALLAALLLALCAPAALAGNSAVTVESKSAGIVFIPGDRHGGAYSGSDLFDDFKNVMPGDRLTQTVELRNACPDMGRLTYSMKAVPHGADNLPVTGQEVAAMNEFLRRLTLTVRRGDAVIFRASPDQADGLLEFLEVATLGRGEKTQLEVILEVPLDLDEKYMGRGVGEVDWLFRAAEKAVEPGPKTGDDGNTALWYCLLTFGFLLLIPVFLPERKKKEDENGGRPA